MSEVHAAEMVPTPRVPASWSAPAAEEEAGKVHVLESEPGKVELSREEARRALEAFGAQGVDAVNQISVALGCESVIANLAKRVIRELGGPPTAKLDEADTAPNAEEDAFSAAIKEGKFDLRGPIGRKWTKDLKLSDFLQQNYEKVGKNYEAQRRFRLQWAEQEREKLRTQRYQKHEHTLDDNLDAEYMCFEKSWEAEGKDAAGLQATKHYWASAISLWSKGVTLHHHEHIKFNARTHRPEVLYIKEKLRFTERHRWGRVETEDVADQVAVNKHINNRSTNIATHVSAIYQQIDQHIDQQ